MIEFQIAAQNKIYLAASGTILRMTGQSKWQVYTYKPMLNYFSTNSKLLLN